MDYGLHLIVTNPTKEILEGELETLAREEGITSVKIYMTYSMLLSLSLSLSLSRARLQIPFLVFKNQGTVNLGYNNSV